VLLPGFRSKINRVDELERFDSSSHSSDVGGMIVSNKKWLVHKLEITALETYQGHSRFVGTIHLSSVRLSLECRARTFGSVCQSIKSVPSLQL